MSQGVAAFVSLGKQPTTELVQCVCADKELVALTTDFAGVFRVVAGVAHFLDVAAIDLMLPGGALWRFLHFDVLRALKVTHEKM